MIATALVSQAYGTPSLADRQAVALIVWAFLLVVFASPVLLLLYVRARRRRQYRQARIAAHTFHPANVHGSAGVASKDDGRRKGWVK